MYTRDKRKQTLLHHASRTGCVECMRIVIDAWDKTVRLRRIIACLRLRKLANLMSAYVHEWI